MSTSRQAFTQVKDILKKLDASIDAARSKRLQKEDPPSEGHAGSDRPGGPDSGAQNNAGQPVRATPLHTRPGEDSDAFHRRVG